MSTLTLLAAICLGATVVAAAVALPSRPGLAVDRASPAMASSVTDHGLVLRRYEGWPVSGAVAE